LKGVTGLNLAQTMLENWSAGGENSAASNIYLNALLAYAKGHIAWDNALDTEFGQVYTTTNKWQKSVDKLNFSSKFGITQNQKLYYSFLFDFMTQYAKGYKSVGDSLHISNFIAPGYLKLALGLDYKPSPSFSAFFSPATGRFIFVMDDYLSDMGAFGVSPGKHSRAEFGAYAKIGINTKLHENISLLSTADFFTPYDRTFGNIAVNWDVLLSMKITKYITTTLNLSLKYDDNTKTMEMVNGVPVPGGAKVQFKEMLGLGIAYTF
jgi:hypothetical protein